MKGNVKKILLIVLLLGIIAGIGIVAISSSKGKREEVTAKSEVAKNSVNSSSKTETNALVSTSKTVEKKKTKEIMAEDGVIYSLTDEKITPDIVVGDNYFDTTLSDINTNFSEYEGKVIEIEGMYLENTPYTFVGRYSESNLCAYCPAGYSYFEYEWHGDKEFGFKEGGDEWLKVIGVLRTGNDGVEYRYIDVLSLEIMNERGQETVKN
ncbi:MAG: hypothetical protein IJ809_02595 [Clostridia bacterium]|nr:hypothetical protein [Clostridia bacterium]